MTPTTTTTPDGYTNGLQPIGALLPEWLEAFNAKSALVLRRDAQARDDFFATGGVCWDCRDTGYVGGVTPEPGDGTWAGEACATCTSGEAVIAEWRAALVRQAMDTAGIPRRLAALSFDTLPASARRRASAVRRFASGWDFTSGRGLFLQGEPSVGKTGLLVSALRLIETCWADETPVPDLRGRLAAPRRRRVWFTTDVALLDRLRMGYDDGTAHLHLERAKTCALLILDDLGKADYKGGAGWGVERLYDIIDARYSALLPTWFSTNLGAKQLRERLGENGVAIMDRIMDSCEGITVTGAKLRQGAAS